jgi:hypothetical protein
MSRPFFNSLTVRSEDQSILTIGVFTHRRLLLAGAFGIALVSCISYIPVLPFSRPPGWHVARPASLGPLAAHDRSGRRPAGSGGAWGTG